MLKYLLLLLTFVVSNTIHHTVPGLFGKPSYTYELPQIDDVSILLSIKGKHDARVWLCPTKNSTDPCFNGIEVLFGYTSNQYVTIRDHWYITETSTFISSLQNKHFPFKDEVFFSFGPSYKSNIGF